ncbi:hypothetical protein [Cohnella sp. WQ 127256]|uniref:hypothetical protein n=1 Tax=Cohnella sp. WQ 127256 TaxID=2938790 RepID=UPI00211751FA|nr:hypothetical protein [Cohnella sp. WQ 127256]
MTTSELDMLKNIIKNVVSMELRVEKSEVKNTIEMMDGLGLKYKNSWSSMEFADHTVIDFWRKDLIKSANRK